MQGSGYPCARGRTFNGLHDGFDNATDGINRRGRRFRNVLERKYRCIHVLHNAFCDSDSPDGVQPHQNVSDLVRPKRSKQTGCEATHRVRVRRTVKGVTSASTRCWQVATAAM